MTDSFPVLTKRQAQRQARRSKILAVAAQCFLTNGYGATTMSSVAAALGGSKETLWSYFSSKEELFVAYLDEATAAFRSRLQPGTNSHATVRQTLQEFGRHYTEAICSAESVGLHRLAISESRRFPEVGRLFYERAPKATALLLVPLLESYMAAGSLRRTDPMAAAERFLGLCLNDRYKVLFGIEMPAEIDFQKAAIKVTEDFLRIYALDSLPPGSCSYTERCRR